MKNQILSHYDEIQGRRNIDKVKELMDKLTVAQNRHGGADILGQFNFQRSSEPLRLKAKVLPEPELRFSGNKKIKINNGSWSLKDAKFAT